MLALPAAGVREKRGLVAHRAWHASSDGVLTMKTNEVADDLKSEFTKGIGKLATLRDEAKLHLHLATLDAKQEWDEKLEPKIAELSQSAHELTDGSRAALSDLVAKVEGFVTKLRGKDGDDKAAKAN